MHNRKSQRGFSLIELMLAMALTGIATTVALGLGYAVRNSYSGQRRAMVVERTSRAVMELITRAVRGASPGVVNGDIQDLVGCSTGFRGIQVTAGGANAPDGLQIVWGAGQLTSLRATYDTSTTAMTVLSGEVFHPGDYVVVTDFTKGHLLRITDVDMVDSEHWLLTTGAPSSLCGGAAVFPSGNYPVGSLVLRARMGYLFIATDASVGNWPTLMFDKDGPGGADPEPVAPGVEDLQIAVGVDTNGDGLITENGTTANDDEWFFNFPGENGPPSMQTTAWRAMRITVTARSQLEAGGGPISQRPGVEDRAGATAMDSYRRRTLSTTIEIRNSDSGS